MKQELTCFKTYDIRGELGKNFSEEICFQIGKAFSSFFGAKKIVVGHDSRSSSPSLASSLKKGIISQGSDVLDIGLAGTEEVYWATTRFGACGGIEVTASHNPSNYNGLKLVKSGSVPLSPIDELSALFSFCLTGQATAVLTISNDTVSYMGGARSELDFKGLIDSLIIISHSLKPLSKL